ncbi:tRNA (guanine(9)-N1)-methyltransferase [Escovopsis weberi]|uniref:tRNA (guanine(9)-N1)-methyltransferase n=1 Tax=Escovopsis weberi TaxID=150374 RepID=A0A0M8N0D4_ESCWE|nr:tRNA (guanine(9)-N1)-methyltransferase [Escovopsis weberi]
MSQASPSDEQHLIAVVQDSAQPMELTPQDGPSTIAAPPDNDDPAAAAAAAPMSKNALKRLRKKQAWDDARDDRRERRREKRRSHKERVRAERAALIAQGADPASFRKAAQPSSLAPVAIVLDCDFERYMTDKERISLASQVTRSYSDNKHARHRADLWVGGFSGALARRFDGVMGGQYRAWKGVHFCEGDFLETARRARDRMRDPARAGAMEMTGPLRESAEGVGSRWVRDERDPFPLPDEEPPLDADHADVVYLSSDSPYTLDRLSPNTCYVIGGLVDKNREKGLCYRRARERGIRTARLPIGEFMVMQSRQVLATNHVVEIMLRWIECGDWGQAFLSVIPKRKGGRLKGAASEDEQGDDGGEGGEDDDGEDEDEDEVDDEDDEDGGDEDFEKRSEKEGADEKEHAHPNDQPAL